MTYTPDELAALELALYDMDYEYLQAQAQRAAMTLDDFFGWLLDELHATGPRPYPPVDRPPKTETVLQQLVTEATAIFGDAVTLAARDRAYEAVARIPDGATWILAFQAAYVAELRRLLRPQ